MGLTTTQVRLHSIPPGDVSPSNDDFARVLRYVSESWMPANPDFLKQIRRSIREKAYTSAAALLDDICRDPGLFGYCLNILSARQGVKAEKSAFDLLFALPLDQIEDLLPMSTTKVSRHVLASANEYQVRRSQQTILATTIAEMLGEKTSSEHARSLSALAFCRQIGLSLVSWNYPRVFSKIIDQSVESFTEIETMLQQVLGFLPLRLGYEFARVWGLAPSLVEVLASAAETDGTKGWSASGAQPGCEPASGAGLLWSCRIAEAVALGADHDSFPNADMEWSLGIEELKDQCGPRALITCSERVQGRWAVHADSLPQWYREIFNEQGRCESNYSAVGRLRFDQNPYISKCSRVVQDEFARAYRALVEGRASEESLKILVSQLIPAAGFHSGCIYLVQTSNMAMRPTIYIGDARKGKFIPAYASKTILTMDPLVRAYSFNTNVRGSSNEEGEEVLYFCGVLGSTSRRAVLYLETSHPCYRNGMQDPSVCFKAIQRALLDALNLDSSISAESD